jgi:LysM repeat protein
VTHPIPVAENWSYDCDFAVSREGTASPVGQGVEVSFSVDFRWKALENTETVGITGTTLSEKDRETAAPLPSVIVRPVQTGENLWTIAKAYATTVAQIADANALRESDIAPGQMLLIPVAQAN